MSKPFLLPLFITLCHIPFFLFEITHKSEKSPKKEKILVNTIHLIEEPTFTPSISEVAPIITPKPLPKEKPANPTPKKHVAKISKKSIQKSIGKTLSKKKPLKKAPANDLLKKGNKTKIAKNDAVKTETEYSRYLGEIILLLGEHLTLPESGKVKLVITLEPGGKVVKIRSLLSESQANLDYLLKNIKEITFPTYTKKEDRVFTIVFCDE
jgi:hypothetical protein